MSEPLFEVLKWSIGTLGPVGTALLIMAYLNRRGEKKRKASEQDDPTEHTPGVYAMRREFERVGAHHEQIRDAIEKNADATVRLAIASDGMADSFERFQHATNERYAKFETVLEKLNERLIQIRAHQNGD